VNKISKTNSWELIKLIDVADEVRELFEPRKANDVPYIGLEHIEQSTLKLIEIGRSQTTVSSKKIFKQGDILFGSLRPYFRKVIRPKFNGVCSTDITVIRAKTNCCPGFLYYFIASESFIAHASSISSGTRMPRANWRTLSQSKWRFPALMQQEKIASILSAYDDLIENNLRRIRILEEMAQNLYREWFVKFRFPGHEQVRFVDSPMGRIPEGWEVKTLGEVAINFDRFRKPISGNKRSKNKGTYPYYGAAKVIDYINDYLFDGIYLLFAEDGSVVTRDRKPVLQYVSGKFWPNNHVHVLQGKDSIMTEFLYIALSELDITGYITGAAQPKITRANLDRIPILITKDSLLQVFCKYLKDTFQLKIVLYEENESLRHTRDLLIPKLISGEVDVSDLEIITPEENKA